MTTTIKNGLRGVLFPSIRILVISGNCYEILKYCPQVTKVWCLHGDVSMLVTLIAGYCKEVQEMYGFWADGELVKSALILPLNN